MSDDGVEGCERQHVHYVFVRFPVDSEAFARVELKGLCDAGCRVGVSTLWRKPVNAEKLLLDAGLANVSVSYGGFNQWFRGFGWCFLQPREAWRVLMCLLSSAGTPVDRLITFALFPRVYGLAIEIGGADVDHVHLFWGHYPSLVGLALRTLKSDISISMFLGAYDLLKGFTPSAKLAKEVTVTTHARVNVAAVSAFTRLEPERVHVVYRGVTVGGSPPQKTNREGVRVVVAERLVEAKRTASTLEVFRRAREHAPGLALTIMGDGPERERLEATVRERVGLAGHVEFRGHVSHKEVQEGLQDSDIFISMSASPSERLPNAVKEAMAHGCTVLVARSPGIDELVVDGETGFVVEPGDLASAAKVLARLAGSKETRERVGMTGYHRVRDRFDIVATTRERIELWRKSTSARF